MIEYIIAVDEQDREIGPVEKIEAHEKGILHRAFSIFIFNSKKELLLQKRHSAKYHSAGLWTNTCCSHPRHGESLQDGVYRRLKEEMGFNCDLKEIFSFVYTAELENNLMENEYDHVFIGTYDGEILADENEAEDFRWGSIDEVIEDISNNPELYTFWFKLVFERVVRFVMQ
jgi:isopentenyl-diphosphate Delta-isomerase